MALEAEALLLHAATRAGLLDHDKGTAALLVYSQLRRLGADFSFGHFLVERGLLSQVALEGLEQNLAAGRQEPPRTISRLGDYDLLELLGEGESGSVFRARQLSANRIVALKVLSPRLAANEEAFKRFLDEARVCAQLRNPHVIRFFRLACCEGLYYIAMELAPGGSLRALLKESGGQLPERRALELAGEVAGALTAAHAAGLLHRDVKPDNILLDSAGHAKLTDLGIAARTAPGRAAGPGAAGAEEFWGTPDSLAPEIIAGRGTPDARSDLYSLGATLYELLAGRPPFQAPTPREVLRLHVSAPPPAIRSLRPGLLPQTAALVMRLLAKDPAGRFPNAHAVAVAIGIILSLQSARQVKGKLAAPSSRRMAMARPKIRPKLTLTGRASQRSRH